MINLKTEYSKRLISLEKNLTAQDRIEAMYHVKISRPTLEKYLRGDVVKFDTAEKLIQFFTDRIQTRINALRGAAIA